MVRELYGHKIRGDFVFGPRHTKVGAPSWTSDIIVHEGEVAVIVPSGTPHSFTHWVVGPVEEVVNYLQTREGEVSERLQCKHLAAAIVEAELHWPPLAATTA